MTRPLDALLRQLPPLFPSSTPLVLKASADGFAAHAARFTGGHAARWFAAVDGQEGDEPFADAHALCSLTEAVEAMHIADTLRADGYWVEPGWLAIASDGAGQHLMIDDHDGRVLAVAHDDDHVDVLAPSAEAWLERLIDGHAAGTVVWDEVFGLVDASRLARINESRRAHEARRKPAPLPLKHQIGLGVTMGGLAALITVVIWWLESR